MLWDMISMAGLAGLQVWNVVTVWKCVWPQVYYLPNIDQASLYFAVDIVHACPCPRVMYCLKVMELQSNLYTYIYLFAKYLLTKVFLLTKILAVH